MKKAATQLRREERVMVDSRGQGLRKGRTYETVIGAWNPGRTMYTYFPPKAKPKDRERVVILKEGKYMRCWKFDDFYFDRDKLVLKNATRRLLSDRDMGLAYLLWRHKGL